MFDLNQNVMVFVAVKPNEALHKSARIVGRTYEERPRYEVVFPDGSREQDVPEDRVEPLPKVFS